MDSEGKRRLHWVACAEQGGLLRLSVVFIPEFNTYKTTERWTTKFVFSVGRNVKGTGADLRKKKRNF